MAWIAHVLPLLPVQARWVGACLARGHRFSRDQLDLLARRGRGWRFATGIRHDHHPDDRKHFSRHPYYAVGQPDQLAQSPSNDAARKPYGVGQRPAYRERNYKSLCLAAVVGLRCGVVERGERTSRLARPLVATLHGDCYLMGRNDACRGLVEAKRPLTTTLGRSSTQGWIRHNNTATTLVNGRDRLKSPTNSMRATPLVSSPTKH